MAVGLTVLMSLKALVDYHDEQLKKGLGEYYKVGIWMGKFMERLEAGGVTLPEEVTKDDFVAIMSNEIPGGGQLTARHNKNKTKQTVWEWDEKQQTTVRVEQDKSNRRCAIDATISVTKEESLLMVKDKQYEKLVAYRAMMEILREMEGDVQVRVRRGGAQHNVTTGEWLVALFMHETTRPIDGCGDPHWHGHAVAGNVTFDASEEKESKQFKALELDTVFRKRAYYEAKFHALCVEKGLALGYGYRRTKDGLVLSVVSPELKHEFCRRTQEIEELERKERKNLERKAAAIVSFGARDGKDLDFKQVYAQLKGGLGEKIRRGKDEIFVEGDVAIESWKKRAGEGVLENVWATARNGERIGFLTAERAQELAIRHAFANRSVIRDVDLFVAIAKLGGGAMSVAEMERFCAGDPRLARNPQKAGFVTTWEIVREQEAIRDVVREGVGRYAPVSMEGVKVDGLDERQQEGLDLILTSTDLAIANLGYPGSGKSRMTKPAAELIKKLTGQEVIVVAPNGRAARALANDVGVRQACTIAALRVSKRRQNRAKGRFIFCDEFSLMTNADAKWLLDYAVRERKQICFFGDPKQYLACGRGNPVHDLLDAGLLSFAQLTTIYRQRNNPKYLEIAEDAAKGKIIESCEKVEAAGWMHEFNTEADLRHGLVEELAKKVKEGKRAIVIAHEHANGIDIRRELRTRLKDLGILGQEDIELRTLTSVQLTDAEKSQAQFYRDGLTVKFHENAPGGFKTGEEWDFKRVHDDMVIGTRNGLEKLMPLGAVDSFTVYARGSMEASVGDQLLATRNDQKLGVSTGDTVRIVAINGSWMTLDNGRTVDASRGIHFRQGWTLTGPAAQGDQKIPCFVYMPTSESGQFNVRQWATDITRGQEELWVGTDCIEVLKACIVRPSEPESALELIGENTTGKGVVVDLQKGARKTRILQDYSIGLMEKAQQKKEIKRQHRRGIGHEYND